MSFIGATGLSSFEEDIQDTSNYIASRVLEVQAQENVDMEHTSNYVKRIHTEIKNEIGIEGITITNPPFFGTGLYGRIEKQEYLVGNPRIETPVGVAEASGLFEKIDTDIQHTSNYVERVEGEITGNIQHTSNYVERVEGELSGRIGYAATVTPPSAATGVYVPIEAMETQIEGIQAEITGLEGQIETLQGEIGASTLLDTFLNFWTGTPSVYAGIASAAGLATAAQTTANSANSKADTAVSTANAANTKADTALTIWNKGTGDFVNNIYHLQSGNVAIGTTTNTLLNNKLEVNGSINIATGNTYKINNVDFSYSDLAGNMPIATTTSVGGVKADGTTITITADGTISSQGGSSVWSQDANVVSVDSSFVDVVGNLPILRLKGTGTTIQKSSGIQFLTHNGILGSTTLYDWGIINEADSGQLKIFHTNTITDNVSIYLNAHYNNVNIAYQNYDTTGNNHRLNVNGSVNFKGDIHVDNSKLTTTDDSDGIKLDYGKILRPSMLGGTTATTIEEPTPYTTERMYPPVRNLTSASYTMTGQTYGNGVYNTEGSAAYSSDTQFAIYSVFNNTGSYANGPGFADGKYTNGVYNSTDYIVSNYKGDYIIVELPVNIMLTKYGFRQRTLVPTWCPGFYKIYGSNDKVNWDVLVDNNTTKPTYTNYEFLTSVNTSQTYKYFGLVVNQLLGSASLLNFDEWFIYGKEILQPTTIDADYKYLAFTHSGGTENQTEYSINFPENTTCDILVVGGGGGGGGFGGGGGGGAVLFKSGIVLNGNYTLKVGKGGTGAAFGTTNGTNGQASSITISSTEYIAIGGGGGGTRQQSPYPGRSGNTGGSGGGGSHSNTTNSNNEGGSSTKNTYTGWESYGNPGGGGRDEIGSTAPDHASGGGGGAGGAGQNWDATGGGNGGIGKDFSLYFGTNVGENGWFAGGGGGNTYQGAGDEGYGDGGANGLGGGGNGGYDPGKDATTGINGTGGGGGGGRFNNGSGVGANGGSGIVIIRYKLTNTIAAAPYRPTGYLKYTEYTGWKFEEVMPIQEMIYNQYLLGYELKHIVNEYQYSFDSYTWKDLKRGDRIITQTITSSQLQTVDATDNIYFRVKTCSLNYVYKNHWLYVPEYYNNNFQIPQYTSSDYTHTLSMYIPPWQGDTTLNTPPSGGIWSKQTNYYGSQNDILNINFQSDLSDSWFPYNKVIRCQLTFTQTDIGDQTDRDDKFYIYLERVEGLPGSGVF